MRSRMSQPLNLHLFSAYPLAMDYQHKPPHVNYLICNDISRSTAIECPALADLTNGTIVYASDTIAPYDFGTTATHSCDPGYSFDDDELIRTCVGDGSSITGEWDMSEPTCERKLATPAHL